MIKIIDYLMSIKEETDRMIIKLNNSEINLEIYYPNTLKLVEYEDEGEQKIVLDTKTIHICIPESEINAEETYDLNQSTLNDQDAKSKKDTPNF